MSDHATTPATPDAQPRDITATPFCWCAKSALRRIREALDDDSYLDQALAVYLTHCELASDEQAHTYDATRRKIGMRSGVSIRRVQEIHNRLHKLKLLDWKQNRIEGSQEFGPSTYTLLGLGTPCPTLGTPSPRLGTNAFSQTCTVVEESLEESPEESPRRRGGPPKAKESTKPNNKLSVGETIDLKDRLEAIKAKKKEIRNRQPETATGVIWDELDRMAFKELKAQQAEIERQLGYPT